MGARGTSRREWTPADLARLEAMAGEGLPSRTIARRLGRSATAIRIVAHRRRISLAGGHAGQRGEGEVTLMESLVAAMRSYPFTSRGRVSTR